MEALLIIFGEMLFALLAPLFIIVFDVLAAIAATLFGWLSPAASSISVSRRTARRIGVVLGGVAAVLVATVFAINTFFFDQAARFALNRIEARTAIQIDCESIEGSLISGALSAIDCDIRRSTHPRTTFAFELNRMAVDVDMTSLIGNVRVNSATVSGVSGWLQRLPPEASKDEPTKAFRPRRVFVIDQLDVDTVDVTTIGVNKDGRPFDLDVQLEQWQSAPFRSDVAWFDMLFRSRLNGTLAGAPLQIETQEQQGGRVTRWRASALPIAELGAVTGGALSWFSAGTVDIEVYDEWSLDDGTDIEMDWRLELSDVEIDAPTGTSLLRRAATKPLRAFISRFSDKVPFTFKMVLNENQFEFQSSLAGTGFWDSVGEYVDRLLAKAGVEIESDTPTGTILRDSAIGVLDRVRKRRNPDEEQTND